MCNYTRSLSTRLLFLLLLHLFTGKNIININIGMKSCHCPSSPPSTEVIAIYRFMELNQSSYYIYIYYISHDFSLIIRFCVMYYIVHSYFVHVYTLYYVVNVRNGNVDPFGVYHSFKKRTFTYMHGGSKPMLVVSNENLIQHKRG